MVETTAFAAAIWTPRRRLAPRNRMMDLQMTTRWIWATAAMITEMRMAKATGVVGPLVGTGAEQPAPEPVVMVVVVVVVAP